MSKIVIFIVLLFGALLSSGCGPDMGAGIKSSIGVAATIKKCRCGESSRDICMQCPDGVGNSELDNSKR